MHTSENPNPKTIVGRIRFNTAVLALVAILLPAALISCTDQPTRETEVAPEYPSTSTSDPQLQPPTPTPIVYTQTPKPVAYVSPSLEEQVFSSEFILRASLLSATASTETAPSGPGIAPTYRALNRMRFTAHEYLKGNGPSEIVVTVRGRHSYTTQSEAQVYADLRLQQRNAAWDDRQGVLFLNRPTTPGQAGDTERGSERGQSEAEFAFTLSNFGVETVWDYSVDTLSRAWLPANGALRTGLSSDPSTTATSHEFITDGSTSPAPVVSLDELRSAIAEMEDTLASGAGVPGFAQCIHEGLLYERHRRAVPYTPYQNTVTMLSWLPAGTEIYRDGPFFEDPTLLRLRFTGTDSRLFGTFVQSADSNPRYGYDRVISVLRPLPTGRYNYEFRVQDERKTPCGFAPEPYLEGAVTVTAPVGTLHEAFFDPAALGAAVGYTAEAGTLYPTAFSIDGFQTSIEALNWEGGLVTLELSRVVPLSGSRLDFIALDGSVYLSLSSLDAQSQGNGTFAWDVEYQPWRDGDELMIRITWAA